MSVSERPVCKSTLVVERDGVTRIFKACVGDPPPPPPCSANIRSLRSWTAMRASSLPVALKNVDAFKRSRNRRGTGYRLLLAVERLKTAAGRSRGRER